jgi:FkbH-like protein
MTGATGIWPDIALELSGPLKAADYHRLARAIARGDGPPDLAPLRLAVLATYNFALLEPFLIVEGARQGLRLVPWFGGFGQIEQLLAQREGSLYAIEPDALVISMRPDDLAPDAVRRFFATEGKAFRDVVEDILGRVTRALTTFRGVSQAPVVVANFAEPPAMPLGVFDANAVGSLTYALAEANVRLREAVAAFPNVAIWDYAGLVRSRGTASWSDARLWAMTRTPIAAQNQPALAAHLVRTVSGLRRAPAKCLVMDLDNTLWGGVIGDDGLSGIQLGDDFPGNVFKEFQRCLLGLVDRGVLLAVASKNDPEVVQAVFREHPEMLIRWEDLAAARINWQPKSANLRDLAAELNIGSDQLVFFDDNPVERAEVRINAPEVLVVEVPENPIHYAETLAALPWFDQPRLSVEDRQRTALYRQERLRRVAHQRYRMPDEFLATLEMVAEVGECTETTLGRIAQLVAKTNQFNLTTRRHSEAEIVAMAGNPNAVVAWLRLADRFGEQGLVAVGILLRDGQRARVDTFLMSCRVMNRCVEQAMIAYLAEHARRWGCRELAGEYLRTRKNGMVAGFYRDLGFRAEREAEDGSEWVFDLVRGDLAWPRVISRKTPAA